MKPISVGISGYWKNPQKICPHTILLFVEQPQPQQNATSSNCYGRILCNHLSTCKRFDKLWGIPLILSILMLFSMLFNFIELHSIFDLGINLYLHVKTMTFRTFHMFNSWFWRCKFPHLTSNHFLSMVTVGTSPPDQLRLLPPTARWIHWCC